MCRWQIRVNSKWLNGHWFPSDYDTAFYNVFHNLQLIPNDQIDSISDKSVDKKMGT